MEKIIMFLGGREEIALFSFLFLLAIIFAITAYIFSGIGIFVAGMSAISGLSTFILLLKERGIEARLTFVAGCLLVGAVGYLVLYAALFFKRVRLERRKSRMELEKRICYTLPDRDNSFVRARLNTALRCEEEEVNAYMDTANDGKLIKLAYVRKRMEALRQATLSKAERMELEELSRAFFLYFYKEKWSVQELRALNEICALVIKLSAKYT